MEEIFETWNSVACKNKIKWLNFVSDSDLAALYSGAAFFAYPSMIEGFGLPILEAMSVGCPVLTSNISSMPEVGGDAALYVDPFNLESIADGLLKLAYDSKLRGELSAKGEQRIKIFTWDKFAHELINVYERAGTSGQTIHS